MIGIALKIGKIKGDVVALKVINSMFKKIKKNGCVYYPSDATFSLGSHFDEVLFYFKHNGVYKFVVADIERFLNFGKAKGVPSDLFSYDHVGFSGVNYRDWFLISNMREVSLDYVSRLNAIYSNSDIVDLLTVMKKPNLYHIPYVIGTEDKDILIK